MSRRCDGDGNREAGEARDGELPFSVIVVTKEKRGAQASGDWCSATNELKDSSTHPSTYQC